MTKAKPKSKPPPSDTASINFTVLAGSLDKISESATRSLTAIDELLTEHGTYEALINLKIDNVLEGLPSSLKGADTVIIASLIQALSLSSHMSQLTIQSFDGVTAVMLAKFKGFNAV